MPQPFVDPCGRGVIEAQPCPRELRREIPARRRRVVLAACVLASSMALIDGSTTSNPRRTISTMPCRVITRTPEVAVIGAALLLAVGGALARIHVEHDALG